MSRNISTFVDFWCLHLIRMGPKEWQHVDGWSSLVGLSAAQRRQHSRLPNVAERNGLLPQAICASPLLFWNFDHKAREARFQRQGAGDTMQATGDPTPAQEHGYADKVRELEDEVGRDTRVRAKRACRGFVEALRVFAPQALLETILSRLIRLYLLPDRVLVASGAPRLAAAASKLSQHVRPYAHLACNPALPAGASPAVQAWGAARRGLQRPAARLRLAVPARLRSGGGGARHGGTAQRF